MLVIFFFEALIGVVCFLGSGLVTSKYMASNRRQDFYVALILAVGGISDLGVVLSQVAFSLHSPALSIFGYKIFLATLVMFALLVWIHLADVYGIKARLVTFALSVLPSLRSAS